MNEMKQHEIVDAIGIVKNGDIIGSNQLGYVSLTDAEYQMYMGSTKAPMHLTTVAALPADRIEWTEAASNYAGGHPVYLEEAN